MRRKLVVGNWKMHGSRADIEKLLTDLQRLLPRLNRVDTAVCPPFVYLSAVRRQLSGSAIGLGAQNVAAELQGAFTGEISAAMLRDCGCTYAIVGHSERRQLFHESNELVAKKTAVCLQQQLAPIVCVGETRAQHEASETLHVIAAQLGAVLAQLDEHELARIVIAYEPVWAIGTGLTATPEQAQAVHAFIRETVQRRAAPLAEKIVILYGGSVKADNAAALFAQPDIDGGLVGGASLNAEEFAAICKAAE